MQPGVKTFHALVAKSLFLMITFYQEIKGNFFLVSNRLFPFLYVDLILILANRTIFTTAAAKSILKLVKLPS